MEYRAEGFVRVCRVAAVLGLCGFLLAGCSKKSDQEASSNSQVIARVGNEVITVPEFENELRLQNIAPDKQKDQDVVKRVLNEMVTRKYLLSQAMNAKLDREPNVLLELLRSREQVLGNAYISRAVSTKLSAISRTDIEKYVANNPLKFADRKVMTVEQIGFPLGANPQTALDATKNAGSLDEVDQRLTAINIPHNRSMGTINSSEVPDELMNNIRARKADDIFFVRAGQNGVFLKVKSEGTQPLEGEMAFNTARQLIRNDLLKAETGILQVSANMEAKYEGVYAKIMSSKPDDALAPKN